MDRLLKNVNILLGGAFQKGDILLRGGLAEIAFPGSAVCGVPVFDMNNAFVFPGFADVHVHLREPGFSYKETIKTGTLAAARGGVTALGAMPNLSPAPDCPENLRPELELIAREAAVGVYPLGCITRGRRGEALADMDGLAPLVCAFSDDGDGVASDDVMRAAMLRAAALGKPIAAHCEDRRFSPEESEQREVERNIRLARETGCALHICHVSKKESLGLIRAAKAEGLDVTCESAPHYLLLDDTMLADDGRFRMNPPIGHPRDRAALIDALRDGTIDMIATDHAPHAAGEKNRGFRESLNGVAGLECSFAALYTGLVRNCVITLERLVELMSAAPRRRFGLGGGCITPGAPADFCVFELDSPYTITGADFLSMGKSTPFEGRRVYGRCLLTYAGGNLVWEDKTHA